jgi:alpha-galactosidase
MISTGLAAKGFVHINVDEGWLKGRSPNGSIFEDRDKFPSGMKALGDWIHDQVRSYLVLVLAKLWSGTRPG